MQRRSIEPSGRIALYPVQALENPSLWLRPHQPDPRDLAWRSQPLGRPPVSGAAAGVDPHLLQPGQARGEWLLEAHEQIPWPELAAVRVSGDLQVEAGRGRRH